ncbi:outer membrane beta-barrel protein [Brumimicrobium mesophilum]|uniref:outer membrane beta-barrel protein n=1 Tax=Brumimicrobium mesophilum TaxID=392717 RepID=UPI000D141BF1|nr:outer membrane beta-barrel protein [Brumimicrobium mesophilum]
MRKTLLLTTVLALIISGSAFSQIGVKAGFALGEPLDNSTSNMHLGFDVGITYEVTEKIRTEILFERLAREENISLGFLGNFPIKTIITPITIGADYTFLTGQLQTYAGLNLGMYRFRTEAFGQDESDAYFGFYPKIGFSYEVTSNIFLDANLKYHLVFNKGDKETNLEGIENLDGLTITEASNTTIFGANIGIIYKFN